MKIINDRISAVEKAVENNMQILNVNEKKSRIFRL